MFNLMKAFALCVCARCVADTMQHGVLFLFGEGINWARYFDVSKPLGGFPKKLEIELAVLNSSKVINPRNVSERRWDFQRDTQEVAKDCIVRHYIVEAENLQLTGFLFPAAWAQATRTFESEAHCIGSLVIGHEDELGFVMSLTLEGSRSYYKNLKRRFPVLRQNTVTHIETIGNCCWTLYGRRKLEGDRQLITPGPHQIFPDIQPRSIKKSECLDIR